MSKIKMQDVKNAAKFNIDMLFSSLAYFRQNNVSARPWPHFSKSGPGRYHATSNSYTTTVGQKYPGTHREKRVA